MIQTIRVKTIIGPDLQGEGLLNEIHRILNIKSVTSVETAKVYRLEGINQRDAKFLAEKLLCEKINQTYTLNKPILAPLNPRGRASKIEIAYKPGVMNPEVASIIKAAKDLGIKLKAADSSREYGFYGKITKGDVLTIIDKLNLFNKTVEHIVREEPKTLLIKGKSSKTAIIPIRNLANNNLLSLSKDKLFLNLEEMKIIQDYFRKQKRDPTDCEIETLAQTWSEHSGHKTFKAALIVDGKKKNPLIARIKKEALKHKKNIVSAFVDNSGVMDFYQGFAICGKGETHNSPSAIEPYGGAATGSGGVFRDIVGTGLGAKTIVSTDIFCLAPKDMPLSKLPEGCLPPQYLLKRVIAAVRDYGNRMGIPTNNGSLHFHSDFRAKPTVFVGAYGILPKKYAKKGSPKIGDIVVSIGGRVGRDGIHGATFSSGEMTDRTITVNSQAVQIGNAIEEKRTFDVIQEARDHGVIRAIQDGGGGGLSSAIGEMAEKIGVSVQLKNARLKYQGLSPWEIWLSESQERMILAVPKTKLKILEEICQKYNVEISTLGKFDGSKKLKVYYGKKAVCNLGMRFLHHGLPQRTMIATKPTIKQFNNETLRNKEPKLPQNKKEWETILEKVLSHGNVCSKEPILRRYDHSVQGTNALVPFGGELLDGPNDASVIRPILNKPYGMVVAHGLNPVLNNIDPYWGSIWATTEAIANYVAVGGDYRNASLINNYIWPFPDEESLWSLDRSVGAVVDFMKILKIPVISGKDSLSSTYRNKEGQVIKIPPVLIISVFGKIPNVSKTASSDFKKVGSTIVLIGKQDFEGMGGSVYFDIEGILGDKVPKIDLKRLPKVLRAIHRGIKTGKILACHDVSEGGLITSIFEMCVGGNIGAKIGISHLVLLFNETAGCFVVEVENEKTARKLFKNIPFTILGKTTKENNIVVSNGPSPLFKVGVEPLKRAWQKPMREVFGQ